VSDWVRKAKTISKVNLQTITLLTVLGFLSAFFWSCDGSGANGDAGAGADSDTAIFPPVVFMAANNIDGSIALYASFDDGTEIIELSGALVVGGDVVDFEVSPDGNFVAYVADQDKNGLFELYVVPVDKASDESAVKVSVALEGNGIKGTFAGSGEYYFAWAPDSSRVAYIADAADPVAGQFELFSSTPNGREKDLISDLTDPNTDVRDFQWEPESSLIAYVADQETVGRVGLYVSPPDSNTATHEVSRITIDNTGLKELTGGSGKYAFAWAPDSFRIAYIADQEAADRFELFTSEADGANNIRFSQLPAGDRDVSEFKWSPDSQRIAYTANQNIAGAIDLFSRPTNAGANSQINSSGLSSGQVVSDFKWAPDSSRIAFISDKIVTDFFRLYSVQPVNSKDILISGGLSNTSDVTAFEWAPDSSRIGYIVDAQNFELYSTQPARASSTQISGRLVVSGDVFDFEWAPDSSRIAYTADHDTGGVIELYSAPPDNSENEKVSGDLPLGGDVVEFNWAPDSSGVGYIADQDFNNEDELFASRPNGDDNTLLSGDPLVGGDVSRFEWVP
jgi:Tol biopolymer transport system component